MKIELFPFQQKALREIREKLDAAVNNYNQYHTPQVVSFTAPTGSGKTIIMSALIENIFFGDENHLAQRNAVVVWLSDSPPLNEQSKNKIESKADRIRSSQCVTISADTFDAETFEDGKIYFLNTQKLASDKNLVKHGDSRTYTIWETIANTVKEKSDRLYFIIDEAHRGMNAGRTNNLDTIMQNATSIMQKFIKGSEKDGIPAMPVVIGMSATMERFNALVEGTTSTVHKVIVNPEDVRSSGLLKDRIIITYPEESEAENDIAILQAAADDWKEKWEHWKQYCFEQHYAYVNPVFVIQVLKGSGKNVTETNLYECIRQIEERTGFKLEEGQVVHAFDTKTSLDLNGFEIRYEEPSRIADDRNIRIVFFKENLSTGWDCPRAETMMSFRKATDYTYVAQLLGRMIRTPMQMRILVDDTLNDVHLFLPHFNEDTVKQVVDSLQKVEGGEIPTEIISETTTNKRMDTWVIRPAKKTVMPTTSQQTQNQGEETAYTLLDSPDEAVSLAEIQKAQQSVRQENPPKTPQETSSESSLTVTIDSEIQTEGNAPVVSPQEETTKGNRENIGTQGRYPYSIDCKEVVEFINSCALTTYQVRSVQITDYLKSLFDLSHFFTRTGLYSDAVKEVTKEIVDKISDHVKELKATNEYDKIVQQVKQFKLTSQTFDISGKEIEKNVENDLFSTDADVDRQFDMAEKRLCNEGIGLEYIRQNLDEKDTTSLKIDVIIFAGDTDCINDLYTFAKEKFHNLNDTYRRSVAISLKENPRDLVEFDRIIANGDIVSSHNFRLPETIKFPHEEDGEDYKTHLFVDETTGKARIKLKSSWERQLILEEEQRPDFVCWIRNFDRKTWSLCIPYKIDNEIKALYPDFIVVRRDKSGYLIDILEPHSEALTDNAAKAIGLAAYAAKNSDKVGRVQLIRKVEDAGGNLRLKRLDLAKSLVQTKMQNVNSNEELNHLFKTDGFYDRN